MASSKNIPADITTDDFASCRGFKGYQYNPWIAITRSIMCLMVILLHCWEPQEVSIGIKVARFPFRYAVPIFMILSFYLTAPNIVTANKSKLTQRLRRIAIPMITWGIISWVVFSIRFDAIMLDKLGWTLLADHCINTPLWFLWVMFMLTCIFYGIFRVLKPSRGITTLIVLSFISFMLQYSCLNYTLLENLPTELSYPLGRLVEMIPYATAGITLYQINTRHPGWKQYAFQSSLVLIILICVKMLIWLGASDPGWGYSGLALFVGSVLIFATITYLPYNKLSSIAIARIRRLSAYTLGIYCMHILIYEILDWWIVPGLGISNINHYFITSITIYIIGYGLCYMIDHLSSGRLKMLVC